MSDDSKKNVEDLMNEAGLTDETVQRISEEVEREKAAKNAAQKDSGNSQEENADEKKCDHDPDTLAALARERADFMNYRSRAQKEQERMRGLGKTDVILQMLPIMDEINRANEHEEIESDSPFGKIVQKFESALEKLGVSKFGIKGEIFDPSMHEALMNREAKDEDEINEGETKIDQVVEAGYKLNDEIFRTAKVTTVSK